MKVQVDEGRFDAGDKATGDAVDLKLAMGK
jgi:hypothetical protein